jgi:hypothetical protein
MTLEEKIDSWNNQINNLYSILDTLKTLSDDKLLKGYYREVYDIYEAGQHTGDLGDRIIYVNNNLSDRVRDELQDFYLGQEEGALFDK